MPSDDRSACAATGRTSPQTSLASSAAPNGPLPSVDSGPPYVAQPGANSYLLNPHSTHISGRTGKAVSLHHRVALSHRGQKCQEGTELRTVSCGDTHLPPLNSDQESHWRETTGTSDEWSECQTPSDAAFSRLLFALTQPHPEIRSSIFTLFFYPSC